MNWYLIIFKYLLMIKTTPSNGLRNDVLPNALFKVYDLQKKLKNASKTRSAIKKLQSKYLVQKLQRFMWFCKNTFYFIFYFWSFQNITTTCVQKPWKRPICPWIGYLWIIFFRKHLLTMSWKRFFLSARVFVFYRSVLSH